MDFLALRDYSHDVKQVFSRDRWCLTGDAGAFIDPLYSPGSDFIAIANGFVCDLIDRDHRGEDISGLAEMHDQTFRALVRTYMVTFQRQYFLMGHAQVMPIKIIWDFVMYWGGVALIFFRNKFCDAAFMERALPLLRAFAVTNIGTQALFREWARKAPAAGPDPGTFVDYAEIGFLMELNRNLLIECDDDALIEKLLRNLELARQLQQEIAAEASLSAPDRSNDTAGVATTHLADVFAALRPTGPASGSPRQAAGDRPRTAPAPKAQPSEGGPLPS
jgi:hypothetical protein